MILLDVLGRRWALRVIWELHDGALGFRELRTACGNLSPTILSRRVQELCELRIVEKDCYGNYMLNCRGAALVKLLLPLHEWAEQWSRSVS
jgi:DNA-binding HxlR family transcriptional regulator